MHFQLFRSGSQQRDKGDSEDSINSDMNQVRRIATDLTFWRYWNAPKLISKEDFGHLHKLLGFLVLINFLYRGYLVVVYRHMGFDSKWWMLLVVGMHGVLSVSSLMFHLPNTRVKGAPMIYPEFRAHSILFACRSLVVMVLIWLSQRLETIWPLYLRGPCVLLTMFIADKITESFKDHGTTMRAMPFPDYATPGFRDNLNTFYSVSQMFATANCIFAGSEEAFMAVFPIQIAAFLMTCVRKSIISAGAWHFYYALALFSNYMFSPMTGLQRTAVQVASNIPVGNLFFALTLPAIYLRIFSPYSINKYLLWGVITACHMFSMYYLGWYTNYPVLEQQQ